MKLTYIVEGPVRGVISTHRRLNAACKALIHDQRQCSGLGGGSYSDARVRVRAGESGPYYTVPVAIEGGEWRLGEWEDRVPDGIREAVETEARS